MIQSRHWSHRDSDSLPQEFMPILIFTWTIPVAGGFTGAVCSYLAVTSQSHCLDTHFRVETVRMKSEIAVVNPFIQRKICAFAFRTKIPSWNCFQGAHEMLAFFKHVTNLDWECLRAEICLCLQIYVNCPILSDIWLSKVFRKAWEVWGTGRSRRRQACVENPVYLSRIDTQFDSSKLGFG